MMLRTALRKMTVVLPLAFTLSSQISGQSSDYDKLVAQAKAELGAGQMDQALGDSKKAIALQANRWDAHTIAGYALQSQKRYDEAIDEFTNALQYAPADKEAEAKRLLQQCMSEKLTGSGGGTRPAGRATGTNPVNAQAAVNQPQTPAQGPTLEATMAFIQEKLNGQSPAQSATRTVSKGITTMFGRTNDQNGYLNTTYIVSEGKGDPQTCIASWKVASTQASDAKGLNRTEETWTTVNLKGGISSTTLTNSGELGVDPLVSDSSYAATNTSMYWTLELRSIDNTAATSRKEGRTQDRKGKYQPTGSSYTGNRAYLFFADKNLATRVADAFEYAAALCNPAQLKTPNQSPF